MLENSLSYASAGVDIAEGERAVSLIKAAVASTVTPGVLSAIGGFGGLFEMPRDGFLDPVLVSSTDGVGTKAYVAALAKRYSTIGVDLVAMCVDDIAVLGATPLFILDYLSVGQLDSSMAAEIVTGIAKGAKECGTALLGGEMAEHPGSMPPGHFDLAGFVVGVAEKSKMWGSDRVRVGDAIVGIDSPNLRSNGFSLARRALFGTRSDPGAQLIEHAELLDIGNGPGSNPGVSLFDELLEPSIVYSPVLGALGKSFEIHAAAHVTGGGLRANLARVLPEGTRASIYRGSWDVPTIFRLIQERGSIADAEMEQVFNMGVGMALIVESGIAPAIINDLARFGRRGYLIGEIESALSS